MERKTKTFLGIILKEIVQVVAVGIGSLIIIIIANFSIKQWCKYPKGVYVIYLYALSRWEEAETKMQKEIKEN